MDALTHLAHQRQQDLHATADAIRLERLATANPTSILSTEPTSRKALAVVVTDDPGGCAPEAQAA